MRCSAHHLRRQCRCVFFFNDTATTEIYTLSLHDALPIYQHYWLALRLQERGIRFRQCANAFLQCSDPKALQKLADSLTADDLITCAQKWLASFTPFFTAEERDRKSTRLNSSHGYISYAVL